MRTATIYRAVAVDGEVLYIGRSGDLATRLRRHRTTSAWWAELDHVEHDAPQPYDEACLAEARQIAQNKPRFNVRLREGAMVQFPLRIDRRVLDRLRAIAEAEHHTLVSKLRVMIDREIAEHESERSAAA